MSQVRWLLLMAFLWAGGLGRTGASPFFPPGNPAPVLTRVSDVKSISQLQAADRQPVQINGVITYYDPAASLCFIQDDSGGIFVNAGAEDRSLQPGQLCKLTGVVALDQGRAFVDEPAF